MLVDLTTAKLHLRVMGTDEDALITLWISAAERMVSQWLNRNVYADSATLIAAVAAVPTTLASATAAYDAAILAAEAMDFGDERDAANAYADQIYGIAKSTALMTRGGMVVDELVKAAILMIVGHLYENRQEVLASDSARVAAVQIPMGAHTLLQPYRILMGV